MEDEDNEFSDDDFDFPAASDLQAEAAEAAELNTVDSPCVQVQVAELQCLIEAMHAKI